LPSRGDTVIRVDHRELPSGIPEALAVFEGISVEVESLDLGDYVIGPDVVVERKSAADLAASIVDRRLFGQLEQLEEAFKSIIYLIEGQNLYEASNLHPNAIRGAVSYLVVLSGANVVYSRDAEDSASLLATMARHAQHGLGYDISMHAKRRATSPRLRMRYLVEDLPGIGPRIADALLVRFDSVQQIANASVSDLETAEGIGPKRAQAIYELLHRSYTGTEA